MNFEKPKDFSDADATENALSEKINTIQKISRIESPSQSEQEFVRETSILISKLISDQLEGGRIIPNSQEFAQATHGVIKADNGMVRADYIPDNDMSLTLELLAQELPYRNEANDEHRSSLRSLLAINIELAAVDAYDLVYRGNLEDSAIYICTMFGELAKANPDMNALDLLKTADAENEG